MAHKVCRMTEWKCIVPDDLTGIDTSVHFDPIQFLGIFFALTESWVSYGWASRQCAEELSPALATLDQTNSFWHSVSKSSSRNLTNKIILSIRFPLYIMTRPKNIAACVEEYFQVQDTKDASKSSKTTALEKSYEEIFQCNSTEESLVWF